MARLVLSEVAVEDIADIARYTIERFGVEQARRYRDALEEVLSLLTVSPGIGVLVDEIHPGTRRYPHQSHSIYYRASANEVLVLRVLHQHMDATSAF